MDQGGNDRGKETVTIGGFDSYSLTAATEVDVARVGGGRYAFSSSTMGDFEDNPLASDTLTPQQAARSVNIHFSNVAQFTMTMAVSSTRNPEGARNILFSGRSAVAECGVAHG